MNFGLIHLPAWGVAVVALVLAHITIVSVTIYLHRHQSHHALSLHPIASHFFRFWLWLTTGMSTRVWVAIHRKHHAHSDLAGDPHSPQVHGLRKVLLEGAELYRVESRNAATLARYGHSTPDDWLERNVYAKYSRAGIASMLIIDVVLFGPIGLTVWAVQMLWIPFFAAGVINGVGHYFGYRSFVTNDASRNIVPWGILIGGEELHNNHHAYIRSARFSQRKWEFDIGWMYIRLLEMAGLAKVRVVAPTSRKKAREARCDEQLLNAVLTHRYAVLMDYSQSMQSLARAELDRLRAPGDADVDEFSVLDPDRAKPALSQTPVSTVAPASAARVLAASPLLRTIQSMRSDLTNLWTRSSATTAQLVQHLEEWCLHAEASDIDALRRFSQRLRTYA